MKKNLIFLFTLSLIMFSTSCVEDIVAPDELSSETLNEIDNSISADSSKIVSWQEKYSTTGVFHVYGGEELLNSIKISGATERNNINETFAGVVNVNKVLLTKGEVGEIYSFLISPFQPSTTKLWNLILVKTTGGDDNWHIREYASSIGIINNNTINKFTGEINHYSLDGKLQLTRIIENGNLMNVIFPNSENSRIETCSSTYETTMKEVCEWEYKCCQQRRIDGEWVETCSMQPFEHWVETCDNGSSDSGQPGGGTGNDNGATTPIDQLVPISNYSSPFEEFTYQLTDPAQDWFLGNVALHTEVESLINSHGIFSQQAFAALELIESLSTMGQLDPPGINAFKVTIRTIARNYYGFVFDQSYYSAIADAVPFNLNDPYIAQEFSIVLAIRATILKEQNPSWSDWRVMWEATRETIQFGLDIAGLVPVFGEVFDLANASIYFLYGDGVNASLSLASAVPGLGLASASVKLGLMRVLKPLGGYTDLKWIKKADGNIDFGNRRQLRDVLGITDATLQAHHIIPWASAIRNHSVVQKAAKSDNAFHMNQKINGIPVESSRNSPNHDIYNNLIASKLDNFNVNFPNASPEACYNFLSNLIQNAENWIKSHPTSHLNNLILP